ncbi:MAG: aspartate kinase [Bacteroidia bacterium]
MRVFKFGGASVKNAEAVKNVKRILQLHGKDNILVVVSAMDKTTNALEKVVNSYFSGNKEEAENNLIKVREFHVNILNELFEDKNHPVYDLINNVFVEIEWVLDEDPGRDYGFLYDQIVSQGEFLSTRIISEYLNDNSVDNLWLDVRDCIKTDNSYREGKVEWNTTDHLIKSIVIPEFENGRSVIITQGFVGCTSENYNTTLGREGSDYTAAIFGHALDAEEVVIWKDVSGVYNADPKYFPEAEMIDALSYNETIELAFYGASVIHPKTIKPLENKKIPLKVKSFVDPNKEGSVICFETNFSKPVPCFIYKRNQVLISVSAMDFSFIIEENLSRIFQLFAAAHVKINLMQNSAISFSVCTDNDPYKIPDLIDNLQKEFRVLYNTDVDLLTIRHYTQEVLNKLTEGKEILLEQRSRNTVQVVMR